MIRRVLLLAMIALGVAGLVNAASDDATATPKAVLVSQEKVVTTAPVREKASAQDKIWSGLVYATNVADPKEPPAELQEFAGRLKRVFGYNQFQLTGSAANAIDADGESWLVPSKSFYLSVKARRASSKEARGGYLLNLQLFQDQRPLVDTEAKLAPGSPLFIRGPQCGKGQLIIVLQVQR